MICYEGIENAHRETLAAMIILKAVRTGRKTGRPISDAKIKEAWQCLKEAEHIMLYVVGDLDDGP